MNEKEMLYIDNVPVGWQFRVPGLDQWITKTAAMCFADPKLLVEVRKLSKNDLR